MKDYGVQTPNEIFEDLNNENGFKTWKHRAYAYTYYYLISYLYRNSKYGQVDTVQNLGLNNLNAILGLGSTQPFSYITKRGGLLDKMNYTETSTDYPIDHIHSQDGHLIGFLKMSDIKKEVNIKFHGSNFSCKIPLRGLNRRGKGNILDGVFFDYKQTHKLSTPSFIKCMTTKDLGHVGFYLYGFLRMMNDRYINGYNISIESLGRRLGMKEVTLRKYTKALEENNLISVVRYAPYEKKTNTYYAPESMKKVVKRKELSK